MYGKLFESAFTGTLYGSGPTVFAVWSYVIAKAEPPGTVELNPKLLAGCLGTDVRDIQSAIDFLCQPDPASRNPEHGGRRLLPIGAMQYQVVSFAKYRAIRHQGDRNDYMREYMRNRRANSVSNKLTEVNGKHSLAELAQAEAEAENKKSMAINGRDQFAEWFETFWRAYPRKAKKPAALKSFRAIKPNAEVLSQMLAAIEAAKASEQWQDAKYIPHPATWLNNRRWEDEAELPLTAGHRNAVSGTRFVA